MGNGYGACDASPDVNGNNAITVVCYNVYYDGYTRNGTIEAMCNLNADVVILQETNANWEREISNNTMIQSKFKHIKCINDKFREGGSILLTNYPIASVQIIERYHQWWYCAHRFILSIDENTSIQLYSIHLVAPYPPIKPKYHCGRLYCCGENKDKFREKEIGHCLNEEYYNPSLPTIIVGDFNCMDGQCHDFLTDNMELTSSWNNVKKHRYHLCCWHKPYSWRGMLCKCCCFAPKLFDHIYFSSKHFELIQSKVLQVGESDHFPVQAMLKKIF